jgi:hypothetical protein
MSTNKQESNDASFSSKTTGPKPRTKLSSLEATGSRMVLYVMRMLPSASTCVDGRFKCWCGPE